MITLAPHLRNESRIGKWWRAGRKTMWGCPKCGQAHALISHKVNEDGNVMPSVICGKCDFHDYISLEEVAPEAVNF
jgi:ribosomal protein S27AE